MQSKKAKQLIVSSLLTAVVGIFLINQQAFVTAEAVDTDQNGGGSPTQDFPSVGNYLPSNPANPEPDVDASEPTTDANPGYFPPAPNYSGGYYGGGVVSAGETAEAQDDDDSSSDEDEDNRSSNGLKTPTNQESIKITSDENTQKIISSIITPGNLISLAGVLMMLMTLILLVSRFLKKNNEKINSLIENDTSQTKSSIENQTMTVVDKKPKKNKSKPKQEKKVKKQARRDKTTENTEVNTSKFESQSPTPVEEIVATDISTESQITEDSQTALDGNNLSTEIEENLNVTQVVKDTVAMGNDDSNDSSNIKQNAIPTPPSFKTEKTANKNTDKNDSANVSFVQKYNSVSKHPEVIAAEKMVIDSADSQSRMEKQHRFVEIVNQLYKANNSDSSETKDSNPKTPVNTESKGSTSSPKVVEAKSKKSETKPVIIKRSKSTTTPVNKKVN